MNTTKFVTAVCAAGLLALTGCTSNSPSAAGPSSGAGRLTVTSTADKCNVSAKSAPSGNLVFNVTNTGNEVTEFYLLGSDGLRIVGEVENIAPSLSRDLVVRATPGKYFAACKPGMVGAGIRSAFTVTDSGVTPTESGDQAALLTTATTQYAGYVKDQTEQLLTGTKTFVAAYLAGNDARARSLYASTRLHWERIEPVAESFGDLDPKMDLREADVEQGAEWTGWHRIEKDLWPPKTGYTALSQSDRKKFADDLLANTQTLFDRTRTKTYTADGIANGAKSLLDEVATGKVTGEEEIWSHTDLSDFQGNLDGARVGFEGLRPALHTKDVALETSIATKFAALQKLLDQHKKNGEFAGYDTLTKAQVKELSDGVNALSEPLSKLTAAVTL